MRPLEYGIVDQSEDEDMDVFENGDRSQRPTLRGHRRRRLSVRTGVLIGVVVIIGGVAIGKMKSRQPVNEAEEDYLQSPGGNSLPSSHGGNDNIAGNGSAEVEDEDENDMATDIPTSVQAVQDASNTDTPSTGQTCDKLFDCISDRLGQNEPMSAGQAICSRDGRYAFGMELSSSNNFVSLLWKDCATGETKKYYRKGEADAFFTMDENAKFAVHDGEGHLKWEKECVATVEKYPRCLAKPTYDCPYLHLHRGGVVVLNYIDGWDWISKNIKKMYEF